MWESRVVWVWEYCFSSSYFLIIIIFYLDVVFVWYILAGELVKQS